MPSRGLKFTQEIRDAIDNSDRLLLILGPCAVRSDYVRAEWEYALLFAKGVVPVLRLGDYSMLPEELSGLHCPDFREPRSYSEALEELKRLLAQPVPKLGPLLTAVPALPPHFTWLAVTGLTGGFSSLVPNLHERFSAALFHARAELLVVDASTNRVSLVDGALDRLPHVLVEGISKPLPRK